MPFQVDRRHLLRSSFALAAGSFAAPALTGRAEAAPLKLKLSSSQANDPKFANGRVYYDNLVKQIAASNLAGQIDVAFFPDNQLGQEIDVINSVKLGVINLIVSKSSIAANLVPVVGTYDHNKHKTTNPQQTKTNNTNTTTPNKQALL